MIDFRQLYIDYLYSPAPFAVDRHGRPADKTRARVRNPQQYENIEPTPPEFCVNLRDHLDQGRNVWVWSDQHFGHKNIIRYSERPFTDLDEMRETMIQRHNELVAVDDIVIWIGDVAFLPDDRANDILHRLTGYKILVVGNHDMQKKKVKKLHVDEVHLLYTMDLDDVTMVFTHFPLDNLPYPYVNVHGHTHNNEDMTVQHINMSVERIDYRPVNLNDVICTAQQRVLEMQG